MAVTFPLYVVSSPFLSLPGAPKIKTSRSTFDFNSKRCERFSPSSSSSKPISAGMEALIQGHNKKLMEFPHLTSAHRDLMIGIISSLENHLDSHLLPSSVPPDVQFYQNQNGTSQGSLHIRSGVDSSPIDFILASWLHLKQPTSGSAAINITNLQGYLKPSTDVPHFQFELVQCSPTYLILFLDITPRKDIVLHPDYLKTYYEETQLETYRQKLEQVPETKPYFSSSLYFRHVVSPTGILISIKCDESGGLERSEEIIREYVSPIAYDVMGIWLDRIFEGGERSNERDELMEKRDRLIKSRAVDMDLSSSMPSQFGQEVANRVLGVIKNVFSI